MYLWAGKRQVPQRCINPGSLHSQPSHSICCQGRAPTMICPSYLLPFR
jgi:hypothetical protein